MNQSSQIYLDTDRSLTTGSENSAHHLRAFILALVIVILFFPCLYFSLPYVVKPFIRELLAQPFTEKDQGMLLQMEALHRLDVMPVYGSSELRQEMDMRGNEFFKQMPTGFQLCPVGAAGNASLMMAQKIAAQGKALHGQKIAFIISHTWFRRPETPTSHMEGNFSPLHAISFLQDKDLDDGLRARYVARLLTYPNAMDDHPVINAYLNLNQEYGWKAETIKYALNSMLSVKRAWYLLEDRLIVFESLFKYDLLSRERWKKEAKPVHWTKLIMDKEQEVPEELKMVNIENERLNDGSGDEEFLKSLRATNEWDDFALLLDTLKYFQADPLIITVPMPGPSLNRRHVSRAARDYYYNRIESMCKERGIACETFADQDLAVDFLIGSGTHLETKGWLYVNRLLDDFYHNRIPDPVAENNP